MLIISDITIPSKLYLRDPLVTKTGKEIIGQSIILMDELGFEKFTFRKLAKRMESNETTIYRYFENKHMLLLYLVVWYWNWVCFLIDYNTKNIDDPCKKMDIILENFVDATKENPSVDFVNERILHRIIIAESAKAYHTKNVDLENKEGLFLSYNRLIEKVSGVILEIDKSFAYPHSLATSLFEMANNQIYFSEHLPKLTDIKVKNENYSEVLKLLRFYVDRVLLNSKSRKGLL